MAVLQTPLMVAFIPGQSPPDVKIPILMFFYILMVTWFSAVKIRKNYKKKIQIAAINR
jgi:hypothetical protein